MRADNAHEFLGTVVKDTKCAVPKNGYLYHGEFGISDLSSISRYIENINSPKLFNAKDKWPIPKGYKFYQVGVCLNNTLQNNKFGNIEIKFVKNDSVIVPDENADLMIVINLHLVNGHYKNANQLVFGSLADTRFHKEVNEFFNTRSLRVFNHDDDIYKAEELGFKPNNNESKFNLNQYKKLQNIMVALAK
jgi:hypothetical protein